MIVKCQVQIEYIEFVSDVFEATQTRITNSMNMAMMISYWKLTAEVSGAL